jgi:Cu2+-containing amine oxidase
VLQVGSNYRGGLVLHQLGYKDEGTGVVSYGRCTTECCFLTTLSCLKHCATPCTAWHLLQVGFNYREGLVLHQLGYRDRNGG